MLKSFSAITMDAELSLYPAVSPPSFEMYNAPVVSPFGVPICHLFVLVLFFNNHAVASAESKLQVYGTFSAIIGVTYSTVENALTVSPLEQMEATPNV